MKNILIIVIGSIIFLFRIIFYPFKIICNLVYGKTNIVGYAWYSKEEYRKLIDSFDDKMDEIVPTYDLWKDLADKRIQSFFDEGWVVIKVNIEVNELEKWLRNNGFLNTVDNRQKYVDYRLRNFLDDALI